MKEGEETDERHIKTWDTLSTSSGREETRVAKDKGKNRISLYQDQIVSKVISQPFFPNQILIYQNTQSFKFSLHQSHTLLNPLFSPTLLNSKNKITQIP